MNDVPPQTWPAQGYESLVASASKWMDVAMSDWSRDDYVGIATHAPLALEHLAKAALWKVSPTLLVPLSLKYEASLVQLATKPNLSHPELRTIGLGEALARLERIVAPACPVEPPRRRRVVDCRNGSMHVGEADAKSAKHVLTDILLMINWLLAHLEVDQGSFYVSSRADVAQVLTQFQSELEESAAQKVAAAKRRYQSLRDAIGDDAVWAALRGEWRARNLATWKRMQRNAALSIPVACPGCGNTAVLVGPPEVDVDVDVENKRGETTLHPYITVYLDPIFFRCDICQLGFWGPDELDASHIPHDRRELTVEELGEFDAAEYLEAERELHESYYDEATDTYDDGPDEWGR